MAPDRTNPLAAASGDKSAMQPLANYFRHISIAVVVVVLVLACYDTIRYDKVYLRAWTLNLTRWPV